MKNYEIYPNTYFMSHNLTPFCCVVLKKLKKKKKANFVNKNMNSPFKVELKIK